MSKAKLLVSTLAVVGVFSITPLVSAHEGEDHSAEMTTMSADDSAMMQSGTPMSSTDDSMMQSGNPQTMSGTDASNRLQPNSGSDNVQTTSAEALDLSNEAAPAATKNSPASMVWQTVGGVVAGILIIGAAAYLIVRRRRAAA